MSAPGRQPSPDGTPSPEPPPTPPTPPLPADLADAGEVPLPTSAHSRRLRGVVLYAVGALLLGAAIWTVARQGEALQTAWESARTAHPLVIVALLALPLVNCLISALVFWVLTTRYGRVGLGEMIALITSAWLLNNLPMRPGLVGRVAYHKAVNGIPVSDSIRVLIAAAASTGAAAAAVLLVAMLAAALGAGAAGIAGLAAAPLLAGLLTLVALRRAGAAQASGDDAPLAAQLSWRLAAAASLRYVDVLVWALRYWLVFRLVGAPIGPVGAAAVAAASQAAMLVPVQLGVREWMVGVAASVLPPGLWAGDAAPGALGLGIAPGLMADLVNRAAEVVVALPVGICAGAWLAARRRERDTSGVSGDAGRGGPA